MKALKKWFMPGGAPPPDAMLEALDHTQLKLLREVRGDCPPVIFLLGMLQRCGTVYAGNLLKQHPQLSFAPGCLWEYPALRCSAHLLDFQRDFLQAYPQNRERREAALLSQVMAAGLIRHLYAMSGPGRAVVVKDPSVVRLSHFEALFPFENAVVLIRDGRDCVASMCATWKEISFETACLRWKAAAEEVVAAGKRPAGNGRFLISKYEDIMTAPEAFVAEACRMARIDPDLYRWGRFKKIKVSGSSGMAGEEEVSWKGVSKPEGFKTVERWRTWDKKRKKDFERLAGTAFGELGYAWGDGW